KNIPVFDNLVIRSAGLAIPLAESLINFIPETIGESVKLSWSTAASDHVVDFVIQRSMNGIDFTTVTTIKGGKESETDEGYSFVDKPTPGSSVVYYRLRQNFKNGKFTVHPLSAVKLYGEKNLSIEQINPVMFQKTFDIT